MIEKTYYVTVKQTYYAKDTVRVKARNRREAELMAISEAEFDNIHDDETYVDHVKELD